MARHAWVILGGVVIPGPVKFSRFHGLPGLSFFVLEFVAGKNRSVNGPNNGPDVLPPAFAAIAHRLPYAGELFFNAKMGYCEHF